MQKKNSSFSRRRLLQGAGLAGLGSLIGGRAVADIVPSPSSNELKKADGKAKNVIFLVADGMGGGTLSLASHAAQHRGRELEWMKLYDQPDVYHGLQETCSANSYVTDSAAAASSWGCGQRIPNGRVNMDENGKALTPLCTYANLAGKATGLVTTCTVTHATPAGFAANVLSRNDSRTIAKQYLERNVDVLMGGGFNNFAANKDGDEDLIALAAKKGYKLCRNKNDLAGAKGAEKVLGLFTHGGYIPFAIDRRHRAAHKDVPSLVEMSRAALQSLSENKNGFLLQIEAGRVDHAGHANCPFAILHEQLEYDEVIKLVMAFQKKNPDTLVVMTSDHGTGGFQLNSSRAARKEKGNGIDMLLNAKSSCPTMERELGAQSDLRAYFAAQTGLELDDANLQKLQEYIDLKGRPGLGKYFNDLFARSFGVGWSSGGHTSEMVEYIAVGPGSETIPAMVKNYQFHNILLDAMGVKK
ncbi:alkaline phosphatase [Persicirhabdus sediminis]|uniref:Alkaline phosphatase n=1 Tax=Persicirhabdus sediminis TaxID=454144 RepID=A0A8J7MDJ9_9BACT|nr:alkaline phosphatase [Persicirhabdus sediminis]MBK1791447.1 alkaline phosphatase [Persicirhabdus sediminis]